MNCKYFSIVQHTKKLTISRKIANILTVSVRQHPIETFSYVHEIPGLNADTKNCPIANITRFSKILMNVRTDENYWSNLGGLRKGPSKPTKFSKVTKWGDHQNSRDFTWKSGNLFKQAKASNYENVTISKQSKLAEWRQLQISQTL